MRIISGKHKNKIVTTPNGFSSRPSISKFREALFSILVSGEFIDQNPLQGANMLEVFSGTGIMSFEALSRGVASITMIDKDPQCLNAAKVFAKQIGEQEHAHFHCADATRLKASSMQFDLVFLDPPYNQQFCNKVLPLLMEGNWIRDQGLIAIEIHKRENLSQYDSLELLKDRIYGQSRLLLYRYKARG